MTTIQQTSANETSDKGAPVPTEAALRRISLLTLAVAWFVFQIWIVSSPLPPLVERPIHLVLALAVVFLSKPLFRTGGSAWLRIADILAVLAIVGLAGFYLLNSGRLGSRMEDVDPIFTQDIIFGGLLVLILLEGVRRTVGWSLLGVILAFLFYATLGPWLPGMAGFSGFRVDQLTEILTMSGNGIWGITTETSDQFVFYFVAFGAFYGAAGGGQLLIDYKLGAAHHPRQWLDTWSGRPQRPQLPLYALAHQASLRALAFVVLAPGTVEYRGWSDGTPVGPGVDAYPQGLRPGEIAPDWPSLLAHWRSTLTRLASAYVAGEAAVDPLPQACTWCHLSTLCRIHEHAPAFAGEDVQSGSAGDDE